MLSSSLAIVIAVVAVSAPTARAGETACAGVDRALTRSFSASVEPEIANQLGVDKVEVLQSFHYGQWRILYAEPSFRDGVFLFYSDDPKVQHFVTEWSGQLPSSKRHRSEIGPRRTHRVFRRDSRVVLLGTSPRIVTASRIKRIMGTQY